MNTDFEAGNIRVKIPLITSISSNVAFSCIHTNDRNKLCLMSSERSAFIKKRSQTLFTLCCVKKTILKYRFHIPYSDLYDRVTASLKVSTLPQCTEIQTYKTSIAFLKILYIRIRAIFLQSSALPLPSATDGTPKPFDFQIPNNQLRGWIIKIWYISRCW